MSERLCGYCRLSGHQKPACPEFLKERNTVLTHTPIERKKLIESLGKVGLGIGALLRVQDYWDPSKYALCIVKDFDWVADCNFVESKNVKYSKKVRILPRYVETDFLTRNVHVNVVRLDGGGEGYRISVPISRMVGRLNNAPHIMSEENYYNRINFTIDAPSHDIDYDPEVLVKNVSVPRRLLIGKEDKGYGSSVGMYGIMPQ